MVQLTEITDQTESLNISEGPSQPPPVGPSPPPPQQKQQPEKPQDVSPPTAQPAPRATPGLAEPIAPGPAFPGPELPPQLARSAGKSAEEIMADLNKSPLFMTELEENDDIAALQALAYEGTPLENASDFKERGNECFREKRWRDAIEFYGRGVQVVTPEEKRRAAGEKPREGDPEGDAEGEVARQRAVAEALYVNRAACQLELRNYRSCWLDCASALRLNPRNVKAWYRSARALLAVGKVEEADDACAGGLSVDADNAALRAVGREIVAKAEEQSRKVEAENRRRYEEHRRAAALQAALRARGVKVRRTARPPDMGDAKLEFLEDAEDEAGGTLSFPTVILYPTHLESDFIKAFNERESPMQHFGYVFPLPWDKEGEYSAGNVECFMETVTGGLVKVGKKVQLLKVLSLDSVEVVDGVVRIYVVPRAKAAAWVQEFKAAKEKEKARASS
ncbi:HSP70/90 co-chaperone [Cytospora paraplurivora]|uniref:HSP70/90 co-chaperone n=1 Tax=Cytospora paraplurivora TaxID=2898453 RepID=A0AAN9YN89_9PEZI